MAAQVAAQPRQFAEVFGRRRTDTGIGSGEVESLRLCKQPVQPDDFESRIFRDFPQLGPSLRGDLVGVFRKREWRYFEARIAALPRKSAGFFKRPINKRLVTNCKFHGWCRLKADELPIFWLTTA